MLWKMLLVKYTPVGDVWIGFSDSITNSKVFMTVSNGLILGCPK